MTEFDLDHLGDLWRAQPDPAEIERLRRSAEAVQRRARWGQVTDAWLALLVSAVVLTLIISNPRIETAAVGGGAIFFMLYSTIRQRRLRVLELATLGASTEHMLDQSIDRAKAIVQRTRFGLFLSPLGLPIGIGFGAALNLGQGSSLLQGLNARPLTLGMGLALAAAGVAICLYFLRIGRNAQLELQRLQHMREAYHTEAAAD